MRFILGVLGLVVFAALFRFLSLMVPLSGALADLQPTGLQQCQRVDIAPGTEDVAIDHETGLVYVATGDRRDWFGGETAARASDNEADNDAGSDAGNVAGSDAGSDIAKSNPKNGIYVFPLDDPAAIRRVTSVENDFLPHGISLWRGDNSLVGLPFFT